MLWSAAAEAESVPAETTVAPVNGLEPDSESVPEPDFVSPVEPVSVLAIVAVTPEATVIAFAARV